MYLILTIKNTYGLWVRISNNFKIIPLLYNKGDKNDPRGTSSISYSMQLIITIKTIYGLWMGISTIFKLHVISKLYNKGGGDDPLDTCLTCKSMNLILTIKDILVYGWGSRPISRYLKYFPNCIIGGMTPEALVWHVSQCILSWPSRIYIVWLWIPTNFKIIP